MEPVRVEPIAEGMAVRLSGDVTLAHAAGLQQRLLEAIESRSVLLDGSKLIGVDFAVLQLLLAARRMAGFSGKPFRVIDSPDGALARCAAAAGLDCGEMGHE